MKKSNINTVINTIVEEVEHRKVRPTSHELETLIRGFTDDETKIFYRELFRVLLSISPINLPYPIVVLNSTADIIAFNKYYHILYGFDVTDPKLSYLKSGELGANVLRVYLDKTFKLQDYFGGYDRWRDHVKRSIKAFQVISKNYTHTKRYTHVVKTLAELYPEFRRIWNEIDELKVTESGIPVPPFVTFYHPSSHRKPLRFAKFEIPQDYLGTDLHFFGHFPDTESLTNYLEFSSKVSENKLYDFLGEFYSLDQLTLLPVASNGTALHNIQVTEKEPPLPSNNDSFSSDINSGEYPEWVLEEARRLIEKVGGTFEQAIETILMTEEAWKNRTPADTQESDEAFPAGLIFRSQKSQDSGV